MRGKMRAVARRGMTIMVAVGVMAGGLVGERETRAENCPDLRVVFARGSGGERWNDQNYLAYKGEIEERLATTRLSYEFIDLDYPAVGVGVNNLLVTAGAFFGSGEAYEFGRSVNTGVRNLKALVNGAACPGTKYVLGGYSQGAMVVSKALPSLKAERLIYAATFGDPKLYLPEGKGIYPVACLGAKLSSYRMYVPDCQAYKGLLGAYIPYEPEGLAGKVGTWCNKRDIFCSSKVSISDHVSYVSENLYEDAAKVIYSKVTSSFNLPNRITSLHDTAILIDSTGSMGELFDGFKAEALRLARETLGVGGRVALYDYRDLNDPYDVKERCNFETCTEAVFRQELEEIEIAGGGDAKESLLSASFKVMQKLNWRQGATKSLVVLTDAGFLSPDRDHTTLDAVVQLSKQIDPVNFYIVTWITHAGEYLELATATDGRIVTNLAGISELTDFILARYDSLPKVEKIEEADSEVAPELEVAEVEVEGGVAKIRMRTNGTRVMIALNDAILGVTEGEAIEVRGLDFTVENIVTLAPMNDERRGEGVEINLGEFGRGSAADNESWSETTILKAPNAGGR